MVRCTNGDGGGSGDVRVEPRGDTVSACAQGVHFVLKIDSIVGSGEVATSPCEALVYIPKYKGAPHP
jgi:hypothetical protein